MIHWKLNSDVCFLTELESSIRQIDRSQGFVYSILSPIFNLPNIDQNTYSNFFWIIASLLLALSLWKMYTKHYDFYKNLFKLGFSIFTKSTQE